MAPTKRRGKPTSNEHHGRVTVPRDPTVLKRASPPTLSDVPLRREREPVTAPASSRYTPPIKSVRHRPGWHKAVGATILFVGLAVIVLNDVMRAEPSWTLLPGGHQEAYLVLGLIIAAYSTRWFGWFDRAK